MKRIKCVARLPRGAVIQAVIALVGLASGTSWADVQPPYRDPRADVDARVADLLGRMTLEEKVAQMLAVWQGKVDLLDAQSQFDAAKAAALYPNGFGSFARPSDRRGAVSPRIAPGRDTRATIAMTNAIQRFALEHTRLGIPVLFHEEGLHGYMADGATNFPQAIGLASSWDPDLVQRVNSVVGREIRARGIHLVLSPVVDVARDPRWGRIEETFGEDPYLVGATGHRCRAGPAGRFAAAGRRQGIRHAQAFHRPWSAGERHQCRAGKHLRAYAAREFLPAVRADCSANQHPCSHAFV